MRFAKLGEQVKDARRHWPAEHAVAAQLGAGVVGDEQHVRPRRIGRRGAKLVFPNTEAATARSS